MPRRRSSSSSSSSSSSRSRSRSRSRRRSTRRRVSRSRSVASASQRLNRLSVEDREDRRDRDREEVVGTDGEVVEDPVNNEDLNNQQLAAVKSLLAQQQEQIASLLSEQKQELLDKVEDQKSKHKFNQRRLEEQFSVSVGHLKIARRISSCLEKGYFEKAKVLSRELEGEIEEHTEDLVAADVSRNGWLTVKRLRNKSVLPTNLLKKIEKEDDSIDIQRKKFVS